MANTHAHTADACVKPGAAATRRCVRWSVIWVELETVTETKKGTDPWQRLVSSKQNMFKRWVSLKEKVWDSDNEAHSVSVLQRGDVWAITGQLSADSSDLKLQLRGKPGGMSEDAPESTDSPHVLLVSVLKTHTEYRLYLKFFLFFFLSFFFFWCERWANQWSVSVNASGVKGWRVQELYVTGKCHETIFL